MITVSLNLGREGDRTPTRVVMEACASAHCSWRMLPKDLPSRLKSGKPLSWLQRWALERARTQSRNQAAVALANKLARVIWAVWKYERSFDGNNALQFKAV